MDYEAFLNKASCILRWFFVTRQAERIQTIFWTGETTVLALRRALIAVQVFLVDRVAQLVEQRTFNP